MRGSSGTERAKRGGKRSQQKGQKVKRDGGRSSPLGRSVLGVAAGAPRTQRAAPAPPRLCMRQEVPALHMKHRMRHVLCVQRRSSPLRQTPVATEHEGMLSPQREGWAAWPGMCSHIPGSAAQTMLPWPAVPGPPDGIPLRGKARRLQFKRLIHCTARALHWLFNMPGDARSPEDLVALHAQQPEAKPEALLDLGPGVTALQVTPEQLKGALNLAMDARYPEEESSGPSGGTAF